MTQESSRRARLIDLLTRLVASGDVEEDGHAAGEAAYAVLYDLGLDRDPRQAVGGLLRSDDEARAILRVVSALDEVLGSVATCSIEERNMQHHGWAEVVASARSAYESLTTAHSDTC